MKGRPTKEEQKLIAKRNELILLTVSQGFSQSETAEIFRLPRNTVHTLIKKPPKRF